MKKENIGTIIKKRRKELHISQEELAKMLGYKSKTSISRLESNSTIPNYDVLENISNVLKLNLIDIMFSTDDIIDNRKTIPFFENLGIAYNKLNKKEDFDNVIFLEENFQTIKLDLSFLSSLYLKSANCTYKISNGSKLAHFTIIFKDLKIDKNIKIEDGEIGVFLYKNHFIVGTKFIKDGYLELIPLCIEVLGNNLFERKKSIIIPNTAKYEEVSKVFYITIQPITT